MLLKQFIGNARIREELEIELEACRRRGVALDHLLLTGSGGTGKTMLVRCLANELAIPVVEENAAGVEKIETLLSKLSYVKTVNSEIVAEPCIVFFDEAHNLKSKIQQLLLTIMLDRRFATPTGTEINLTNVTFAFATTNPEGLFGPLKMRCQLQMHLNKYSEDELSSILSNLTIEDNGKLYQFNPHPTLRDFVAKRARFTPRIAKQFVNRVYNHIRSRNINAEGAIRLIESPAAVGFARVFFELKQIEEDGVGPLDRAYLDLLSKTQKPKGLVSISTQLEISAETVRDEIEPFLKTLGYVELESRGRSITQKGREALRRGGEKWQHDVQSVVANTKILPFAR